MVTVCFRICQVKKDTKNVKRTVVKSVVGTLDLSIRYLLDGETFPGVQTSCLKTKDPTAFVSTGLSSYWLCRTDHEINLCCRNG